MTKYFWLKNRYFQIDIPFKICIFYLFLECLNHLLSSPLHDTVHLCTLDCLSQTRVRLTIPKNVTLRTWKMSLWQAPTPNGGNCGCELCVWWCVCLCVCAILGQVCECWLCFSKVMSKYVWSMLFLPFIP